LPLLGVPIAVKDDTDVAGEPTAFGCGGDFVPAAADAEVVRRLRGAGAVIVGKTNTSEIGQWPFADGEAFGYARNPWHTEHTPGGSSGGSAAAVAAGLVPAALGSDGAGSIRIPAAWNNLVGIKPQRGRIPTVPHLDFNGLTVFGPLARTVADAALLLDVAADTAMSEAVGTNPGPLRIALSLRAPFTLFPSVLHPHVRAGVQRVADSLRALGHDVAVADPDYGVLLGASFLPRSLAGIRAGLAERTRATRDGAIRVDPRTRANARTGLLLDGPLLALARGAESRLGKHIGRIFDRFDVVLAPTTATPPPPVAAMDGLGGAATDRLIIGACPYTWPWNVLGWTAVNVPAGFTDTGLPVGAQLLGPADSEFRLIALAAQLESSLNWTAHHPAAA
ncbi:MAG: amidase, partial [Mycobacteriaceae bacterium]|nr:amidase [Mycobacteriaceae bacterium]